VRQLSRWNIIDGMIGWNVIDGIIGWNVIDGIIGWNGSAKIAMTQCNHRDRNSHKRDS
jgi:hypothetical protein